MTGLELVQTVAAAALLWTVFVLAVRLARARAEVRRLQNERNQIWLGGRWRCECGHWRLGGRSVIPDERGMHHSPDRCELWDFDALETG